MGVAVFGLSAVLLTSIGGAGIFASPVTLPAMYLLVRANPSTTFRCAGFIIGGLTAFEAGSGTGYIVGRNEALSVVVGIALAMAAIALVARVPHRSLEFETDVDGRAANSGGDGATA